MMKEHFFRIKAWALREHGEELAALWADRERVQTVLYQGVGDDSVHLELYAEDECIADLIHAALKSDANVLRVEMEGVGPSDWQTYWQQHFRTRAIGPFMIIPEWEMTSASPSPAQIPLYIRPGLGFGTGDHFTTSYCLSVLPMAINDASSMIDAGTGSGILSIAAAKLGLRDIYAFDSDPKALDCARGNLAINELTELDIELQHVDLSTLPPMKADLVCANLYDTLLETHAERLCELTRKTLITTGIRSHRAKSVRRAFEKAGFRVISEESDPEWYGALLEPV